MGDIELRKKRKEFLDWMKKTAEEDSARHKESYQSFKVDFKCARNKKDWAILLKKDGDSNLFEIMRTLTPDLSSTSRLMESSSRSATVDVNRIKNNDTAKCPYCGNGGWVKCGCGKLSCGGGVTERDGREWYVCPWCGKGGFIEGTFKTIDGEMKDIRRISGPKSKPSLPKPFKSLPP